MKSNKKDLKKFFFNKNNLFLVLLFCVIYFFMFLLQSNVPMLGYDDFILNCSHGKGLKYFFTELINCINTWNGRSSQILAYIIGYFPRFVFWIVNPIMIVSFIYLVYYYCFSESDDNKNKCKNMFLTFLVVIAYILYLFPATFDVFFWMPGACNHLWSVVITLVALIPYYKLLYNKNILEGKNKIFIVLFCILLFVAGSSLENISIFGILLILFTLFKSFKQKKIFKWQMFGSISYMSGVLYLLLLSSTEKRKLKFLNGTQIVQTGVKKIAYIFEYFFVENKIFLFILLALLLVFIIYIKVKNKKFDNRFKNIIFLLLISLFTLFIFYFVPYYSNRALLLLSFVFLVLIVYILSYLLINKNILFITLCSCFLSINIYAYVYFYDVYSLSYEMISIRNKSVKNQAELKKQTINFDFSPCVYGIRIIEYKEYISEYNPNDHNNYDNTGIKKYYNINYNPKFVYKKNNDYRPYCVKNKRIFNIMGFKGYDVKNKYEGRNVDAIEEGN